MARREIGGDTARMTNLLRAVSAYQAHGWRRALPSADVVAVSGSARLLQYGGTGRPALFIPSLVNPPSVLDLVEGRSLLRWLADNGVRPLLIDWGRPGNEELGFDIGDYVTNRIFALIEAVGEPVDLVGYCLGGTMALAAAGHARVRRLATIAAPWDFSGYPGARRRDLAAYWARARPIAERLGSVPMDLIQPVFWSLDPAASVRKFERFMAFDPESDAARIFVAIEDWANDGPPVALPAAADCFERFFTMNAAAAGKWRIAGRRVDPVSAGKPTLNIVSHSDRIVPAATAPAFGERLSIAPGHVGMIVGSSARGELWQPLADWLRA